MRKIFILLVTLSIIACDSKVKPDEAKETKETKETKDPEKKSDSKIRNGIVIKEEGLKIGQAFLIDHEGNLVSDKNLTKINQPLRVRLIIESGLTVNEGKVSLGGSEKVVTSEGEVVLDEKDLFESVGAVDEKDASIITFTVTISKITKLLDYYELSFRVWDKSNNNSASGSFKFNVE